MGTMGYSQEELAELSEEELEGLKELEAAEAAENGDEDDDDLDAGAEPDADADADADADEGEDVDTENQDDGAEEEVEASTDEAPDAADAANKDGDDEADKEPEEASGNAPKPTFVAPDDLEKRLTDIGKEKDAIAEKFDDGEITAQEHREQLKKLDDEEWALRSQKVRAEVSDDILRQQFVGAATNFVNKSERFKPGTRLYKMLDQEVRDMQEADPGNMYDPGIIAKAAASIEKELGFESAVPKTDPKDEKKDGGKGKRGKKGLADIPPTLADVPASDPVEDDGSEFAHIDRLDGEAHERALAKLSPADRERYMQS